jgi:hypothetical protein
MANDPPMIRILYLGIAILQDLLHYRIAGNQQLRNIMIEFHPWFI